MISNNKRGRRIWPNTNFKVKTERENLEREERELEQRKQAALKNGNGWDEKSNLEINVLR